MLLFSRPLLSQEEAERQPSRVTARLVYEREDGAELCPTLPAALFIIRQQLGKGAIDPNAKDQIRIWLGGPPGSPEKVDGKIELYDAKGNRLWQTQLSIVNDDCAAMIASLTLSLLISYDSIVRPVEIDPPTIDPSEPPVPGYVHPSHMPFVQSSGEDSNEAGLQRTVARSGRQQSIGSGLASLPLVSSFYVSNGLVLGVAPDPVVRFSFGFLTRWTKLAAGLEVRLLMPSSAPAGYRVGRFDGVLSSCYDGSPFFFVPSSRLAVLCKGTPARSYTRTFGLTQRWAVG